ncbi:MAG TPA: hypothetical protein VJ865_07200 [Gemmatimonadaceae bacterium]|nr:hypothetical protein [Gemmatimonadaceae bacterium]
MSLQTARYNIASHVSIETAREFDLALHAAIPSSLATMVELQRTVRECVKSLKAANVSPVQMILAMKACALDSAGRYRLDSDEYPATTVDLLMEQIIRWSIAEYYQSVS